MALMTKHNSTTYQTVVCLATFIIMLIGGFSDSTAQQRLSVMGPYDRLEVESAEPVAEPLITEADLRYQNIQPEHSSDALSIFRNNPGMALLGSAIFPGSGQAINRKWWRAGLYIAIEAASIGFHVYYQKEAERQEKAYMRYANNNWSVVNYAKWLVDYNNYHNGTTEPYSIVGENLGDGPSYDISIDWQRVDLTKLRELERQTLYYYTDGTQGQAFSHVLPDYGSQQYYELISKYFQYGPGWNDFGTRMDGSSVDNLYQLPWNGAAMSPHFLLGADKAETFNDNYRRAGNLLTLLLANHIASALDAYFTVKIANRDKEQKHTIDPSISFSPGTVLSLKYNF